MKPLLLVLALATGVDAGGQDRTRFSEDDDFGYASAMEAAVRGHTVVVANRSILLRRPVVIHGVTYVPLRDIVEAVSGTVNYSKKTNVITVHVPLPPLKPPGD